METANKVESITEQTKNRLDERKPININSREEGAKKKIDINKVKLYKNEYKKKHGTDGFGGQVYETKLLCFIFFRTLHSDNIKDFLLCTNMEGTGAFDDIILRYKSNVMQKPKLIFLQAKHRDDITRELTIEDIQKPRGDFALPKYFESYLKIKQKLDAESEELMFQGPMKDIDCDFIIYTPAIENVTKKEIGFCLDDSIFKTGRYGKMFQLKYDDDDIDITLDSIGGSRAIMLAKTLSKFILKDNKNVSNIFLDELMKTYHVYLAQNIIEETTEPIAEEDKDNYFMAKFRQTFLTSKDNYLLLMKNVICKELAEVKGITDITQQKKIDDVIKSHTFKLPIKFGNRCFSFLGNEKKQEKRLTHLCFTVLKKLLDTCHNTDAKYNVVKLDDDSIGPGKLLLSGDLESYRLGGLIGNLLILDDTTAMLKFNTDKHSLSNDNIKILNVLQGLKENYDLSKYRFDINITTFPRLSLISKMHDRQLLVEFLKKLKFYTNQAKEDEVENILKKEIDRFSNIRQKQNEFFIRVKCDAIFLKFHDKIQKWWQQPNSAPYLTRACKFYHEAKTEILDSPLLNVIHYICSVKMRNISIQFEKEIIHALNLNTFLNSDKKVMLILTAEITFSAIKVIQYFDEIRNDNNYVIIDINSMIIENCLELIKSDLTNSTTPTLIIITKGYMDIHNLLYKLNFINAQFKGKLIIITDISFLESMKTMKCKKFIHIDNKNNFSSLSMVTREMILRDRKITFQGEQVIVGAILNNTSLNFLTPNALFMIINNKNVLIGKSLASTVYSNTVDYYINRNLNRWISLYPNEEDDLCYINVDEANNVDEVLQENKDIICITNTQDKFEEICKKYSRRNIHWVTPGACLTWKQSQGSLNTIIKYTLSQTRDSSSNDVVHLKTLKDIQNKIVIIAAEPGEGKSTLLTHLAINTKRLWPDLWILRINLIEYINHFSTWDENKINIDFKEAMYFLYSAIGINDFNNHNFRKQNLLSLSDTNEIFMNNYEETTLCQEDISQINLFNYFYNNNKLAVLFDGFDEICPDYANEVIHLFKVLKSLKLAHLWVTTRPYHILKQLELALGTFSFHLTPLNKFEQKMILQNLWSKILNLDKSSVASKIEPYVDLFLEILDVILYNNNSFMSYPLHIFIITDLYTNIFQDFVINRSKPNNELANYNDFIKQMKAASNLTTMYEHFTNKKFYKIRFGDKNDSINLKHPDTRRIIEKERKEFVNNHKKISAFILLNRKILSKRDLSDVYKFVTYVKSGQEKTGFIMSIMNDDQPRFVHKTFAEYFAVEFIFDKLRLGNCTTLWQYLINDIMSDGNIAIHRFINSKLQKDSIMTDLIANEEHINVVCDIINQDSNKYFGVIHFAIDHGYEYITILLLQYAKTLINKDNLSTYVSQINTKYNIKRHCILCTAVLRDMKSIVNYVIELVADIDSDKIINLFNCQDSGKCNPMLVITNENIARIVFTEFQKTPEAVLDLFSLDLQLPPDESIYTIFNRFQRVARNHIKFLTLEQRAQILNVKDLDGHLLCNYGQNDSEFRKAIDEFLGK